MSSNRENNKRALDAYRKQLKAIFDDVRDIDITILNKAVNVGMAEAKRNTRVISGFMRRSWRSAPAVRSNGGVTKSLVNSADYSSYVNYGHRIVNKDGETVGWVKGQFILDRAVKKVEYELSKEFKNEVERVNKKHDK